MQAFDHGIDTLVGQFQTIEQGSLKAIVAAALHITLVGGLDGIALGGNGVGNGQQRLIFVLSRRTGHGTGGLAGILTQGLHVFDYIHRSHLNSL